jgi:hypothetical protein
MNFITKLFRGADTMQAVAEQTEAELAARLAEVERQIAAGEGDVAAALEERERLRYQIQAARIKEERAASRAYQEARTAKVADVNKRIDAMLTELGTHVPRLLFVLQDFQRLADEVLLEGGGDGRQFTEMFSGLDHEFGRRLRAAILSAADVDWNYDAAFPGGKGTKPTPRWRGIKLPRASVTDVLGNPVGTRYQ